MKSSLAAVVQCHYGFVFRHDRLPGSWSSTANALERLLHDAANVLVTVDDYAPDSHHGAADVLARTAARVFRSAGNRSGRGRMRADLTMRPDYPPRCLILSTGEDLPPGQSILARMIVTELDRGDVDVGALANAQDRAAAGVYAQAMAGFVRWLAADQADRDYEAELHELRSGLMGEPARVPSNVANLLLGWRTFRRFARSIGLGADLAAIKGTVEDSLAELAGAQVSHLRTEDPARRYLSLLAAALESGAAHLADPTSGSAPSEARRYGWRRDDDGRSWPQGTLIGYVEDDEVYLIPLAAYGVARRLGEQTDHRLTIQDSTLRKRLHQAGHLATTEGDGRLTVRKQWAGTERRYLHLTVGSLLSQEDRANRTDRPDQAQEPDDAAGGRPLQTGSWTTES